MRHHAYAAAMGLLVAAFSVPGGQSHAAAADPTGFWVKPDSERNAKIQVTKCGKGGAQLCAKIVWLEDPLDSRGRPLQDIRNGNASMRGRPILGLPLFSGLTRTGPATWTGKIYNPEDGNTYSATLTMLSRKQIKLKGCKAWLLCGEKMWLRTSPPPKPEPEEEPQIEASAEPDAPAASPVAAKPQAPAEPEVELVAPAEPPAEHDPRPGYGFLNVSTVAPEAARVSGENVPSMFVMTKPIETDEVAPSAAGEANPPAQETQTAVQTEDVPPPQQKPASKPKTPTSQATAAATPKPAAPASQESSDAQTPPAEGMDPADAGTAVAESPPMTRRQKRALRRQQNQPLLPWLR